MICPQCGADTEVIGSRPANSRTVVWRRRRCVSDECGHRFETVERMRVENVRRIWR